MFDSVSEEVKMLADMARRFSGRELGNRVEEADHFPEVPFLEDVVEKAKAQGLFSLVLPEDLGGMGSLSALGAVLYETGQVCAAFGGMLLTHAAGQLFLLASGDGKTRRKALESPGLLSAALYDEKPEWGAEVDARPTKQGHILNGEARFVPLAPVADHHLVGARRDGRPLVLLIPGGARGAAVGDPLATLGLKACPVADIRLTDCRIAKEQILAEGDDALALLEAVSLKLMGPTIALAAGIAVGSYQEALAYARERYQGGKQIIDHQQVRIMLADLAMVGRQTLASAVALCRAADQGHVDGISFRAAFVQATDDAAEACIDGVQLLGGYGYMQDYGQERRMRDAKQVQLILGRNHLHRLALMNQETDSG